MTWIEVRESLCHKKYDFEPNLMHLYSEVSPIISSVAYSQGKPLSPTSTAHGSLWGCSPIQTSLRYQWGYENMHRAEVLAVNSKLEIHKLVLEKADTPYLRAPLQRLFQHWFIQF